MRVLQRSLLAVFARVVVYHDFQFPRHCVFGDIENAVEMQPFFLGTALEYPYILPPFAVHEMFECISQRLFKGFFGVLTAVERKRYEMRPLLQPNFTPQRYTPFYKVVLLAFEIVLYKRRALVLIRETVLHLLGYIRFALALGQALTLRINRFELCFYFGLHGR